MIYYRLYFMDPRTGHIIRFVEFEAPDDEGALALARTYEGDHPLELWSARRKVARLEKLASAFRIDYGAASGDNAWRSSGGSSGAAPC